MRAKFLLFFFCWALSMWAEHIPEEQARKMATEFFHHNRPQLVVNKFNMVYDGESPITRSTGAKPAFYVYDNPSGKGFVIISGDDIAQPVLGYSYENNFPKEELPRHIKEWLDGYKQQIYDGRKYGVVSHSNSRSLTEIGNVVVQLETAQWNQTSPYYRFLPLIQGKQPYTGCVITATAIVMRYHKWPNQGVGTIPGYSTRTLGIKMPAIELGHSYEWENMPLNYIYNRYTEEQADQVAQLMLDLGTMLEADYNLDGTPAIHRNIASSLTTYMGYDKSVLHRDRSEYSDIEWHELLKNELQKGHPIIYSGHNYACGHAFVLDGYTTNSFYSVNWGWGGDCNGYYLLNALAPEGHVGHYNYEQSATTGLKPDQGGDYIERIVLREGGLSSNTTIFERFKSFNLTTGKISNAGCGNFTGTFLWALTDKRGIIKEELSTMVVTNLKPYWGYSNLRRTCTITVPIDIGDRIRVFYKSKKTPEWTLVTGGEDIIWELLVADEFTIDESTCISRNRLQNTIVVTTKDGVNVEWVHCDGNSTDGCYETINNVTTIRTEGLPPGNYLLKLKKKSESHQVKIKL